MSKVLSAVAAVFFLGGLALTVGYVANAAVEWQLRRTFSLEHVHFFYLGGIAASIGMITLALLEIRIAILTTLEPADAEPDQQGDAQAKRPRAKKSWKKSADVQRSFLDMRDPK